MGVWSASLGGLPGLRSLDRGPQKFCGECGASLTAAAPGNVGAPAAFDGRGRQVGTRHDGGKHREAEALTTAR